MRAMGERAVARETSLTSASFHCVDISSDIFKATILRIFLFEKFLLDFALFSLDQVCIPTISERQRKAKKQKRRKTSVKAALFAKNFER